MLPGTEINPLQKFTLGDFHNTTNPVVTRVRAQTKNRLQTDLFERDPFKVQSYNFYYAERPTSQQFPNHTISGQLNCNYKTTASKLFDTYCCNHGFPYIRHDENVAQASKSTCFRGRKCAETQIPENFTTDVLRRQASSCIHSTNTNCQQVNAQRQQFECTTAIATDESNNTNQQKLSAYMERRQAARNNRSVNTSTTSLSPAHWQTQCCASRECIPTWVCRNEERTLQTDATARAKQAARGTSKAMAAAVGTIGRNTATTNTNANTEASTASTRRYSSGSACGSFTPLSSSRPNVSSWRLCPTTENRKFNARGSCSTTILEKKTLANAAQQTYANQQQNGQRFSGGQYLSPTVEHVVNRNSKSQKTTTPMPHCNSCQISIDLNGLVPKESKTENVIIKIESAAPFKVVSNGNCNVSSTSNAAKIRCKRLNNLMTRKTTTNIPPFSLNITPKASSDTVEMNKWQSKHSLCENDKLNQRRLNCERFFEREDERLRKRATTSAANARKSNDIGHILGSASSKERLPKRVPWVESNIIKPVVRSSSSNTSRNMDAACVSVVAGSSGGSATSKRLESIYNRGLTSLRQLRASIDAASTYSTRKSSNSIHSTLKPLNRSTPSLINCSEPDRLSRVSSSSTFTLPRKSSSIQAYRSISQSSVGSVRSYKSQVSNSTFFS